jgi:predicted nucleic acid-binding protein
VTRFLWTSTPASTHSNREVLETALDQRDSVVVSVITEGELRTGPRKLLTGQDSHRSRLSTLMLIDFTSEDAVARERAREARKRGHPSDRWTH